MSETLTWFASILCALGMVLTSLEALKVEKNHFLITNALFTPLYLAGILQWFLWGVRTQNWALMAPTFGQILFMLPVLKRWYQHRVRL